MQPGLTCGVPHELHATSPAELHALKEHLQRVTAELQGELQAERQQQFVKPAILQSLCEARAEAQAAQDDALKCQNAARSAEEGLQYVEAATADLPDQQPFCSQLQLASH